MPTPQTPTPLTLRALQPPQLLLQPPDVCVGRTYLGCGVLHVLGRLPHRLLGLPQVVQRCTGGGTSLFPLEMIRYADSKWSCNSTLFNRKLCTAAKQWL